MLCNGERHLNSLQYWLKTGIRPNITKIVDREVKDQHKQTKQMGGGGGG